MFFYYNLPLIGGQNLLGWVPDIFCMQEKLKTAKNFLKHTIKAVKIQSDNFVMTLTCLTD